MRSNFREQTNWLWRFIMRRVLACAILALPILLAAPVANAQQAPQPKAKVIKNNLSDEAIDARKECFAEAQSRFPGNDSASVVLQQNRETAYRGCAARKGIRP
jgi:hypothetical protein